MTRNNFVILPTWRNLWPDDESIYFLNIDEQSSKENYRDGIDICANLNVELVPAGVPGMHHNLLQTADIFESKGLDWILYSQHDAYPLDHEYLHNINSEILNGTYNNYGIIGFNVHDGNLEIQRFQNGSRTYETTARCVLQKGDGWYRRRASSRIRYPDHSNQIFAVESVHWSNALISIKKLRELIIPDEFYRFFHAWDDIAFQFLKQDIFNVVDSRFSFAHDQSIKSRVGLPPQSPRAPSDAARDFYYNKWGHLEYWKSKWGFVYDLQKTFLVNHPFLQKSIDNLRPEIVRRLFLKVVSGLETQTRSDIIVSLNSKLPSKTMQAFFEHDPKNGFLRTFDY